MSQSAFWTIADAKARLSELLRRASREGPQWIGTRRQYVVVPAELWESHSNPRVPLGRWLVQHFPAGMDLAEPDRRDPPRPVPFADGEE